ncbi:hypothetical protein BDZ45DRAFT_739933 [Acephala macrosclerotiorum]|nr:hypothetical protein BDZ45DRAFT_739933 [Acephala macrosclerotiorum]
MGSQNRPRSSVAALSPLLRSSQSHDPHEESLTARRDHEKQCASGPMSAPSLQLLQAVRGGGHLSLPAPTPRAPPKALTGRAIPDAACNLLLGRRLEQRQRRRDAIVRASVHYGPRPRSIDSCPMRPRLSNATSRWNRCNSLQQRFNLVKVVAGSRCARYPPYHKAGFDRISGLDASVPETRAGGALEQKPKLLREILQTTVLSGRSRRSGGAQASGNLAALRENFSTLLQRTDDKHRTPAVE